MDFFMQRKIFKWFVEDQKQGFFINTQIRKFMKDCLSDVTLNGLEKGAWRVFKAETANFIGGVKAERYVGIIEKMLKAYRAVDSWNTYSSLSLKLFPVELVTVSDERGEKF